MSSKTAVVMAALIREGLTRPLSYSLRTATAKPILRYQFSQFATNHGYGSQYARLLSRGALRKLLGSGPAAQFGALRGRQTGQPARAYGRQQAVRALHPQGRFDRIGSAVPGPRPQPHRGPRRHAGGPQAGG